MPYRSFARIFRVLESWIDAYGTWAVLVGTFFEGETVLVLGGLAAHRGYLQLPSVVAAAFAGTLAGDQLWFFLGRTQGAAFLARRAAWAPRVARARRLLDDHPTAILIGFRFLYGLRTVTPFVVGMSGFSVRRFLVWNALGAAVWATTIGAAGYLLGNAVETLLGDLRRSEAWLFGAVAVAGLVAWLVHFARQRARGTGAGA